MKYYKLVLGGLLCLFMTTSSAQKSTITPLKIGDKVPEVILQVANYSKPEAKLSDFRGKLVILDFWSTSCSSCILGIPKNENIQSKFGDKVQFLMVTANKSWDNKEKIDKFLANQKALKPGGLTLPVIVQDSILDQYFPYFSYGHHVWINDQGIVFAITAPYDVNEENVGKAIDHQFLSMHEVNDSLMYSDLSKPYLLTGASSEKRVLAGSVFTTALKREGNLEASDVKNGPVKAYRLINRPLTDFFKLAYPAMEKMPKSRWVFQVKHMRDFELPRYDEEMEGIYCYEFFSSKPISLDEVKHKYLKDALLKSFPYTVSLKKRLLDCYLVTILPGAKIKPPKDSIPPTLSKFLKILNSNFTIPVVSSLPENNMQAKIGIPDNWEDMNDIKRVLANAGYQLVKTKRTMTVFAITEQP